MTPPPRPPDSLPEGTGMRLRRKFLEGFLDGFSSAISLVLVLWILDRYGLISVTFEWMP